MFKTKIKKGFLFIVFCLVFFSGVKNVKAEVLNHYYYDELDAESKLFYDTLYEHVENGEESFYYNITTDLTVDDVEKIDKAFTALLYDHVEISWVRNLKYSYWLDSDKKYVTKIKFTPLYFYEEDGRVIEKNLEKIADKWLSKIDKTASNEEKVNQIAKILVERLDYNSNYDKEVLEHNQSIASALFDRNTVCAGYGKTFKFFCDKLSIPCICVEGTLDGANHLWNKVQLDGNWYNIDLTNADNGTTLDNRYMLLPDTYFNGYVETKLVDAPKALDTSKNVYTKNDLWVQQYSVGACEKILKYVRALKNPNIVILGKRKDLNKVEKYLYTNKYITNSILLEDGKNAGKLNVTFSKKAIDK